MKRLECTVHGRVQGVMFRDFVRRTAQGLGTSGAVWNNMEGTVGVIAEGEEEKLQSLLSSLREGPSLADVTQIDEDWKEATHEFDGFTIRY